VIFVEAKRPADQQAVLLCYHSVIMIDSSQSTSTRPYLLRALYEWCADNGLTPYVAAFVDESVRVPREHVKNNEIVLNISMDATSNLKIGNEYLEFKARFGGMAREIVVPIDHIIAIYARENGQGMAFPVPASVQQQSEADGASPTERRSPGLRSVNTPATSASDRSPLLEPLIAPTADRAAPAAKIVKLTSTPKDTAPPDSPPEGGKGKPGGRPSLTRVK
jgi:stringent starvation protein B